MSPSYTAYLYTREKRHAGTLTLTPTELRFMAEDQDVTLPLHDLEISRGGMGDRFVFLKHALAPNITLATTDISILPILSVQGIKQAQKLIKNPYRPYFILCGGALILTILVGLALWGLVVNKDKLVQKVVTQIPITWEEKLKILLEKNLPLSGPVLADAELETELESFTRPLTHAITQPHPKLSFAIVDSPEINAFALPGGLVFINSGLILNAKSAAEVQGVIAHEIGHVVERHHLKQMVETLGLYLLMDAFFGNLDGMLAAIMQNSAYLMTLKFSRAHEIESDDFGFELLVRAGVSPQGMIDFFTKPPEKKSISTGLPDELEDKLSFFATHPSSKKRSMRLFAKILSLKADAVKNPLDITSLQSKILEVQNAR